MLRFYTGVEIIYSNLCECCLKEKMFECILTLILLFQLSIYDASSTRYLQLKNY
jgi:hypothetical protein